METAATLDMKDARFDWAIYADATLAGLSVLIPIPFLDGLFEGFFRKRMVSSIANRRAQVLAPEAKKVLNRDSRTGWERFLGCLIFPVWLVFELVVQLSKKLLYFLTVKAAVDALNYYWQRAYLIDHMVREGHLSEEGLLDSAEIALTTILAQHVKSPLSELARDVVSSPGRIWRSLRNARKGIEDDELRERQQEMERRWYQFDAHFQSLRVEYEGLMTPHPNGEVDLDLA